jgi:hypothetical protein
VKIDDKIRTIFRIPQAMGSSENDFSRNVIFSMPCIAAVMALKDKSYTKEHQHCLPAVQSPLQPIAQIDANPC